MKIYHLDSSIVIPYINARLGKPARDADGALKNKRAREFMSKCRSPYRISAATCAEVMRGNYDDEEALAILREMKTPLELGHRIAKRWALLQHRAAHAMGDNDAWNAALAIAENATLVGSDRAFENRPGLDYIDFMA